MKSCACLFDTLGERMQNTRTRLHQLLSYSIPAAPTPVRVWGGDGGGSSGWGWGGGVGGLMKRVHMER